MACSPPAHERSNPRIYIANYFGHKLHVDQNEKLVHYGVTYVLARDGFSGKIVGASLKNNEVIYEDVLQKFACGMKSEWIMAKSSTSCFTCKSSSEKKPNSTKIKSAKTFLKPISWPSRDFNWNKPAFFNNKVLERYMLT